MTNVAIRSAFRRTHRLHVLHSGRSVAVVPSIEDVRASGGDPFLSLLGDVELAARERCYPRRKHRPMKKQGEQTEIDSESCLGETDRNNTLLKRRCISLPNAWGHWPCDAVGTSPNKQNDSWAPRKCQKSPPTRVGQGARLCIL